MVGMDTKAKLQKVAELVNEMLAAYDSVNYGFGVTPPNDGIDNYTRTRMKLKIDDWASKISGVSLGYYAEFMQWKKYGITKKRVVSTGTADVTVGNNGQDFQKSIQLKSTVQADPSVVTTMMKVALNQLSGERGEVPRDGDRKIVDMTIMDSANNWPFGIFLFKRPTKDEYIAEAAKVLRGILATAAYRKHNTPGVYHKKPTILEGFGINDATRNWMFDARVQSPGTPLKVKNYGQIYGNRSTRPIFKVHGGGYSMPFEITFKIRHASGYALNDGEIVKKAVFHALKTGGNIDVKLASWDSDRASHFRTNRW